jgi:hypothetical protein
MAKFVLISANAVDEEEQTFPLQILATNFEGRQKNIMTPQTFT